MSPPTASVSCMPGASAENGDVYHVHREATVDQADTRAAHPMVCVSHSPHDPVAWKGLPRTTTGALPTDLASVARPDLPFTKDGHWTLRFIRAVRKEVTGRPSVCPFMVTLPEPDRSAVLAFYRNRNKQPPRLRT